MSISESTHKLIYNYPFEIDCSGEVTILMPYQSEILKVNIYMGKPTMWVMFFNACIDDIRARTFMIFGTGQHIPSQYNNYSKGCYIDTIIEDDFETWHIFNKLD